MLFIFAPFFIKITLVSISISINGIGFIRIAFNHAYYILHLSLGMPCANKLKERQENLLETEACCSHASEYEHFQQRLNHQDSNHQENQFAAPPLIKAVVVPQQQPIISSKPQLANCDFKPPEYNSNCTKQDAAIISASDEFNKIAMPSLRSTHEQVIHYIKSSL